MCSVWRRATAAAILLAAFVGRRRDPIVGILADRTRTRGAIPPVDSVHRLPWCIVMVRPTRRPGWARARLAYAAITNPAHVDLLHEQPPYAALGGVMTGGVNEAPKTPAASP
jgi:hypothetical protein